MRDLKPMLIRDAALRDSIWTENIQGLRVFFMPKKGFQRKYAEFFVKYGSNDNTFVPLGDTEPKEMPYGIAHFLEHKMFEKSFGDAFSEFAQKGASANAYTSTNYTSYLFWTVESFRENLETLFRVVFEPYFTDQSVRKEQGIISQEIRMYRDEPGQRLFRELMQNLFLKHPVRVDIAGTEDSIKAITKDLLYLCHSNFYVPENTVLFIAGDMELNEIFHLVEHLAEKFCPKGRGLAASLRPSEPPEVGPGAKINLPVPTPIIQLGWKVRPVSSGKGLIIQEISGTVLLDLMFGKSSAFFTNVYEQGLIDDLSYSYEVWPDYAFGLVGSESPQPERVSDLIRQEIARIRKEGVDKGDFERIKRAAIGRYVSLFDSFDTCGEIQAHLALLGEDIFSYGKMISGLELDSVNQRIKEMDENMLVEVTVESK